MENKKSLDILVSLDRWYLPQLKVLLTSISINNPDTKCNVYLLHREIPDREIETLRIGLERIGFTLLPIRVNSALFEKAPISSRYPQEMYYRLLAAQLLPDSLERVLYLDPDILVINSLYELWTMELGNDLFAAAAHTGKAELASGVNNLRLKTSGNYYNSGVLLINLAQCRKDIVPDEIFLYVFDHANELFLPDQDVLNALYGNRIRPLNDAVWNYDARNYADYNMRSHGEMDTEWVIQNTAILHFCGREKPWKSHYRHRFGVLYQHYMRLAALTLSSDSQPY